VVISVMRVIGWCFYLTAKLRSNFIQSGAVPGSMIGTWADVTPRNQNDNLSLMA